MKPTEQQNNDARAENTDDRNLTPRQIQKRKKMMIFPLFFLAFSGCMWLIFAPSRQPEQSVAGFNTELPTPETDGIVSDKREAYMQEDFERTQRTKMQSLQDFAREPTEEDLSGPVSHPGTGSSHDVFRSAADAHADIDRQIGSFYEATAGEEDEKERMQARIEELERRLEENETSRTTQDEQIALLEKSYEIAARYLNGEQTSAPAAASQPTAGTDKITVQPVRQLHRSVVSRLAAPMPDSVFRAGSAQPRNRAFNTVGACEQVLRRNTIRACVYRTVTVTDGSEVALRLLEPVLAGEVRIPANTIVTGTARIDGGRLGVAISAIQHEGCIIPVELSVYDVDGREGIAAPVSEEIDAVKEIAANMGAGMGSSITITDDAGSQLLSDLGRSAIQGVSSYVSKKMRTVKVTLKAGYAVLLVPPLT